MVKNVALGCYTLLLVAMLVAFASGRLVWLSDAEQKYGQAEDVLQKAIEMHKPEVLQMAEIQILHVPTSKMTGRNWSVNHEFYIYDEGTLKRVQYGK